MDEDYKNFLQELQNRTREIRKELMHIRFKDMHLKSPAENKTWREVEQAMIKLREGEMWLHEAIFELNFLRGNGNEENNTNERTSSVR